MKRRLNRAIKEALQKLATGFEYQEIVEEYAPTKDGEDLAQMELVKRKISSHFVAPDMSAIKLLLGEESGDSAISKMSDQELVELKNKLIRELEGGEDGDL